MLLFLLSFATWAVLHSVMASITFKQLIQGWWGQRAYNGLYRLIYNFIALVTFLPVLYLGAALLPNAVLWTVPWPAAAFFVLIQIAALLGLMISFLQTER